MTEDQQTRPSPRQRLLQVAAVVSALSIVGSYAVWSQHQAGQRAKLKQQAEKASAPEAVSFEGFVNHGSPIVNADGLAVSSKSISMPVFTTRTVEEKGPPEVDANDLISGSKSWAHVTNLGAPGPVVLGEGFDVPAEEEAPATNPYADFKPGENSGFGMISGSKSLGRPLPLPFLDEPKEESPEPDSESP